MIEVIDVSTPEVVAETVTTTVVYPSVETQVIEPGPSDAAVLTETPTTTIVLDRQAQEVLTEQSETIILEVAAQGPPGSGGSGASEYIRESTPVGSIETIPAGYQKLIYGQFEIGGRLEMYGKIVIL